MPNLKELVNEMIEENVTAYAKQYSHELNEEQMEAFRHNFPYIKEHGIFPLDENSRYFRTKRKLEAFCNRRDSQSMLHPLPGDAIQIVATGGTSGITKTYNYSLITESDKIGRLFVCTVPFIPFVIENEEPDCLVHGLLMSVSGGYFKVVEPANLTLKPEKVLRSYKVWADYPKGNGALIITVPTYQWFIKSKDFY